MTETSDPQDTGRARPQDQEPAEGSRETVADQERNADADDPSMGGSSDGDTGA